MKLVSIFTMQFPYKKKKEDDSLKERSKLSKRQVKSVLFSFFIGIVSFSIMVLFIKWSSSDYRLLTEKTFLYVMLFSLLFEFVDSSTGMGFGTSLAPILLVMGFEPLSIVPVLLISESVSGVISGFLHHEFRNYHLAINPLNVDSKITLILVFFGSIGIGISVFLTYYTFNHPERLIKTYISILIIFFAVMSLISNKIQQKPLGNEVHLKRIVFFGFLAGVNKGIGGGGFGPTITLGEMISGVYVKSAIAISNLAEGFVSIVGFFVFVYISLEGVSFDLKLLPAVFIGSLFGSILSPFIVRIIPHFIWKIIIPVYAIIMGAFILIQLYLY